MNKWLSESNAKRSRRIRTDNTLADLAACSFSVTGKRAVSYKMCSFAAKLVSLVFSALTSSFMFQQSPPGLSGVLDSTYTNKVGAEFCRIYKSIAHVLQMLCH